MAEDELCLWSFFKASASYRTDVEGSGEVAGSWQPHVLILGGDIDDRKQKYFPHSF